MDTTLLPARGQIVLVRNDPGLMVNISGTDDGDAEATYIMTRAVGTFPNLFLQSHFFFSALQLLTECMQQEEAQSSADPTKRIIGIRTRTRIWLFGS